MPPNLLFEISSRTLRDCSSNQTSGACLFLILQSRCRHETDKPEHTTTEMPPGTVKVFRSWSRVSIKATLVGSLQRETGTSSALVLDRFMLSWKCRRLLNLNHGIPNAVIQGCTVPKPHPCTSASSARKIRGESSSVPGRFSS